MTLIIGHRGASADFPENTIAAFRGASDQGADGVELDVRQTCDGALVVHHDPVLGDGRVIWHTHSADLPDSVAHLRDALDACAAMTVNVEIKNSPDEAGFDPTGDVARRTVEAIAAAGRAAEVLVSCFDLATIGEVRRCEPMLDTGYLVVSPAQPIDAIAAAVDEGHRAIHPWHPTVDRDVVERAHAVGIEVNVWTVDDPERIRELASWGVDAIITNRPAAARLALA